MKICYTIFHIGNEKTTYRIPYVRNIKKTIGKDIQYLNTKTYYIFNQESFEEYNSLMGSFNITGKLKFGEIGCIASNYNAWKTFLETDHDLLLVIEDDAIIQEDFLLNFKDVIDTLPKDFDLISLYVAPGKHFKYDPKKHDKTFEKICDCYQNQATLSYTISRKGAEKFIKLVDNGIKEPLDLFLYNKSNGTNIYALKPKFDNLFITNTVDDNGEVIREFTTIQDTEYA